jgi:hypothetical protein
MGHPEPLGAPDRTLIRVGEIIAREFSDVVVFRSRPLAVQRAHFGALSPLARGLGYRATYPQLSRVVLAPQA